MALWGIVLLETWLSYERFKATRIQYQSNASCEISNDRGINVLLESRETEEQITQLWLQRSLSH